MWCKHNASSKVQPASLVRAESRVLTSQHFPHQSHLTSELCTQNLLYSPFLLFHCPKIMIQLLVIPFFQNYDTIVLCHSKVTSEYWVQNPKPNAERWPQVSSPEQNPNSWPHSVFRIRAIWHQNSILWACFINLVCYSIFQKLWYRFAVSLKGHIRVLSAEPKAKCWVLASSVVIDGLE